MPDHPRLRGIIAISVTLMIIFVVLAAAGGLFSFSDDGDGPTRFGEQVRINWTAKSMDPPDGLFEFKVFKVSEDSTSLRLHYDVNFTSREHGGWGSIDSSIRFEPFANITLTTPSGVDLWKEVVETTDSDVIVHPNPQPGTWALKVRFEAYGGELLGLEVHDTVGVSVRTIGP
jgi:hypothetical protein